MSSIRYVKEPGYINDLIFIFVLQYNKDAMLKRFVNIEKGNEDVTFYMQIVNMFPKTSEESALFFYLTEDMPAFIAEYYLNRCANLFDGEYDFDYLCRRLEDEETLRRNMIRFYFNVGENEIDEWALLSLSELSRRVFETKLPDNIKNLLTMFFINPLSFSRRLIDDLTGAKSKLDDYYRENNSVIEEIRDKVEREDVLSAVSSETDDTSDINEQKWGIYSCSIIDVNVFESFIFHENMAIIILGKNGLEFRKYTDKANAEIRLDKFGKILSEPNRLKILRMLAEDRELYTSEIAKKLSVTVTAAYYHLEMMEEVRMVSSRTEGRTVYFHINYKYFDEAVQALYRQIKENIPIHENRETLTASGAVNRSKTDI